MIRSIASWLGHAGALSSARASSAIRAALPGQVDLANQLPASRAVLAADARIAAPLRLGLAVGGRAHLRAALNDVLVDPVALAADEPLRRVPHVVAGERHVRAVLLHRSGGVGEEIALLRQRHRQRVLADLVGPAVLAHLDRCQLQVGPGHRCGRARDCRRPLTRLPGRCRRQVGGREEPPAGADERAHADPHRRFLAELLDLAVAGAHRFVMTIHDARVGVASAGPQRRLHRGLGVVEHLPNVSGANGSVTPSGRRRQSVRPGPAAIPPPGRCAASARSTGSCQLISVIRPGGNSPSGGTIPSSASSGMPIGATR